MNWAQSLIKLSNFEVEILQKRLAEIVDRKTAAEMKLVMLSAEGEAESLRAHEDAEAGWYHLGFQQGLKLRKQACQAEIHAIGMEEQGARDALSEAFEALKKYEQVAESARLAQVKEALRRETAALDELGLRKAVGHR
ncbi:MAG: flagellar export protein FliJ [Caulobacteraceae bacterium]